MSENIRERIRENEECWRCRPNPRALRFYQVECLEAIRSWFDGGEEREPLRRPLVVLPTGLGKSSPGPQSWPAASPRARS